MLYSQALCEQSVSTWCPERGRWIACICFIFLAPTLKKYEVIGPNMKAQLANPKVATGSIPNECWFMS